MKVYEERSTPAQVARFFVPLDRSISSGAFNHEKIVKQYIVSDFGPTATNKGAEKARTCIRNLTAPEPTAQNTCGEVVIPLAKVRSIGLRRPPHTILPCGTSISTKSFPAQEEQNCPLE